MRDRQLVLRYPSVYRSHLSLILLQRVTLWISFLTRGVHDCTVGHQEYSPEEQDLPLPQGGLVREFLDPNNQEHLLGSVGVLGGNVPCP
jgi:hypothetical protein